MSKHLYHLVSFGRISNIVHGREIMANVLGGADGKEQAELERPPGGQRQQR